jgi:hypothetical protein
MKADLPKAPAELPTELAELVRRIATGWANCPDRPRPQPDVLAQWDQLIDAWCAYDSLPLFVRKTNKNRGHAVPHPSGRIIVPCDNSPAHWAFAKAVLGEMPSLEEIHGQFIEDNIPVAMIFGKEEREGARYKCSLSQVVNPNAAGWKVAHIAAIGLAGRTPIVQLDEKRLREHFRRLMVPRNMFVVPMAYAGLAELREMCDAMASVCSTTARETGAASGG